MAGGYSSSAVEDETRFIQHEPHGHPKLTRDEQLLRLGVVVRREQAHESQAVNDNNSGGGDVVRKRKRNMFEDDNDDAEVSRSGARYELRWGSGTSQSSRIVRVSRSSGGKDRHSKVLTAKGLRDRRVRLSVSTAIQFYDLQDRLGFDQPSKAVEWLLNAAAVAIDDLPLLDHALGTGTFSNALHRSPSPNYSNNLPSNTNTNHQGDAAAGGINVDAKSPTAPGIFSTNLRSSIEGRQGELMMLQRQRDQQRQAQAHSHSPPALGKHKMSSSSTKSNSGGGEEEEIRATASASKETADNYHPGLSLSRLESRVKARARARERGKGKFQFTANVAADNYSLVQNQHGARDTFTGLLNSVADVALESRDTNQNDHRTGLSMHSYSSHALDHQFHDRAQPILHSPSMMHQHSKTTSEDHNNHLLPSFASNPSALPVLSHDPALNLTMPAFAGRETLQSNSYNNIMAYYTQNPHISLFTTARNTYVQGIYDGRMLHSSNHDCDAAQGSLKGRDKLHPTDHN